MVCIHCYARSKEKNTNAYVGLRKETPYAVCYDDERPGNLSLLSRPPSDAP